MIIWLNGPFGAGKTSTAAALLPLVPGARLFDPETVGYMLMPNLTDRPVTDFQHWEPWRTLVVATAYQAARGWMTKEADLVVDTSSQTAAAAAAMIAAALPGPNRPD